MIAATALERPYPPLLDWLASHDVEYEIREHDRAITATATAKAEGVDPDTFAKVVGLLTEEGRNVLVILDATDQLDLYKARRAIGSTTCGCSARLSSRPWRLAARSAPSRLWLPTRVADVRGSCGPGRS